MISGQTSGTYNFVPAISELVRDAYERIQIYPPMMQIEHLTSARLSLNLLLNDIGGDRGPNLWAVDLLQIPLTPGQITYTLPYNTIDLLDVYLRQYVPNQSNGANVGINVGNVLNAIGPANNPLVALPYGDPLLIAPGSTTFSCIAGSPIITMRWPSHGQSTGNPLFWNVPISIGGLAITGFSIVSAVVDQNTLQFLAPANALETQTGQGATPLLFTTAGSSSISVILPGHGLSVGSTFPVNIAATVGGFALAAASSFTVSAVDNSYQFEFQPGGFASATGMAFMNNGQISVTGQAAGQQYIDIPLFPFSRNDYVALAVKNVPGRPTTYWLNRVVPPNFSIYPVVPPPAQGNYFFGFCAYRMKEIQDANPVGGQILDSPRRMLPAITAELCAALAEKWRPTQWAEKLAAAQRAWDRASNADIEHVTTHITPAFNGYFRN